jgi:hypothetical protein
MRHRSFRIKKVITHSLSTIKVFFDKKGNVMRQATLPWQPFDFMLVYTGKSFAALDKPGVPPHVAALFQREGTVRAMAVLNEMNSYEEQSTVTIVYGSKVR